MKIFIHSTKINFYDCDPAGILFFGRVFELCHQAYESMIAGMGLDEDYWNNNEYLVPVINAESHYHKPIKYGDIITIKISVSELRSSSFELSYRLMNEQKEMCCGVKTVHVFVDRKSWKKSRMKEKIYNGLRLYKD